MHRRFAQRAAVAPAGSTYAYFNPNYQILARVVEAVSGEPFQDYLQAHVFAPLQMTHTTSIVHSAEIAQRTTQLAHGHLLVYGVPVPSAEELGYLAGSGGVISTAEDMAHFLVMQSNGGRFNGAALVAPESVAAMHTPPASPASPYGMGWLSLTEDGRRVLEHDGILSTFTADMALVPDAGYGLALLYDVHSLETDLLALPAIRRGVIALLMNEQPAASGFNGTALELGFVALTLLGAGLALRSLIRLPRWAARARTRPAWRLLPGIAWTFAPAVLVLALPALVLQSSGRAFGLVTLYRSMVSLMTWLSICAVLGLINGTARIIWLARRSNNKPKNL